jgi:hypothetical protein
MEESLERLRARGQAAVREGERLRVVRVALQEVAGRQDQQLRATRDALQEAARLAEQRVLGLMAGLEAVGGERPPPPVGPPVPPAVAVDQGWVQEITAAILQARGLGS